MSFIFPLCSWTKNMVSLAIQQLSYFLLHNMISQPCTQPICFSCSLKGPLPIMYLGNRCSVSHWPSESHTSPRLSCSLGDHGHIHIYFPWDSWTSVLIPGCPDLSWEPQGRCGSGHHHPSLSSPTVSSQQPSTHGYMSCGKAGGVLKAKATELISYVVCRFLKDFGFYCKGDGNQWRVLSRGWIWSDLTQK